MKNDGNIIGMLRLCLIRFVFSKQFEVIAVVSQQHFVVTELLKHLGFWLVLFYFFKHIRTLQHFKILVLVFSVSFR